MEKKTFKVELRLTSFVRIEVEAENAEAAAELAIEELYDSDYPNADDHNIEVESIESIEDR